MVAGLALLTNGVAKAADLSLEENQILFYFTYWTGQMRPIAKITVDPILSQVARYRATDMAARGYFSHVTPEGFGPNYLVQQAGYALPGWWGNSVSANYIESISAGYTTAAAAWVGWILSPPHCKHVLAQSAFYQDQTRVGIGHVYAPGSLYGHYWVIITAPPSGPSVQIDSPATLATVTCPEVAISGTAGGSPATIEYAVESTVSGTVYKALSGACTFSGTATGLVPGNNTIRVRSLNASGGVIADSSVVVQYAKYVPLEVKVSGLGIVTPMLDTRRIGTLYYMAAIPYPGWKFIGWTGTYYWPSWLLPFYMQEGMTFTANFVPM